MWTRRESLPPCPYVTQCRTHHPRQLPHPPHHLPVPRPHRQQQRGVASVAGADVFDVAVVARDQQQHLRRERGEDAAQELVEPLERGHRSSHLSRVTRRIRGVVGEEGEVMYGGDPGQVLAGLVWCDPREGGPAEAFAPALVGELARHGVASLQLGGVTVEEPGGARGEGWAGAER